MRYRPLSTSSRPRSECRIPAKAQSAIPGISATSTKNTSTRNVDGRTCCSHLSSPAFTRLLVVQNSQEYLQYIFIFPARNSGKPGTDGTFTDFPYFEREKTGYFPSVPSFRPKGWATRPACPTPYLIRPVSQLRSRRLHAKREHRWTSHRQTRGRVCRLR